MMGPRSLTLFSVLIFDYDLAYTIVLLDSKFSRTVRSAENTLPMERRVKGKHLPTVSLEGMCPCSRERPCLLRKYSFSPRISLYLMRNTTASRKLHSLRVSLIQDSSSVWLYGIHRMSVFSIYLLTLLFLQWVSLNINLSYITIGVSINW